MSSSECGLIERSSRHWRLRIGTSGFIKWGPLTVGLLCSAVPPAAAEYRIDVGDVIEILVARVPELQRRVSVKSDGSISFPLLGTLRVAGLSPSEAEANIQAALATKIFRLRTPDGRENAWRSNPMRSPSPWCSTGRYT